MTRILLVHPGSSFSTADTYSGLKAGFEACGIEILEYRLDLQLQLYSGMVEGAIASGYLQEAINPFILASGDAIGMAIHYEPDAVFVISGSNFHVARAQVLREFAKQRRKPLPLGVYCTESPYMSRLEAWFAQIYDVVFTNEKLSVPMFSRNERVHYLPHAYNPTVHTPGPADPEKQADVFFVGTGFPERRVLFSAVDWTGINFVTRGFSWSDNEAVDLISPTGVIPNEKTAAWYRSALINLNHHRTTTAYGTNEHISQAVAASLGPRAYEIAACAGFQLCDDSRPELFELFGDAAATYHAGDAADLERQVRYWLKHPDRREETARAQHETVLPHTWTARAETILTELLA